MTKEKLKKNRTGIETKQDISENLVKVAYLSIGSNLGNKKTNIEKAKINLQSNDIQLVKSSSCYETPSWPNKKNPKFINIVVKIKTSLSPYNLMKKCLKVEKLLGRVRNKKNDPRICDIDIIDYDQKIISNTAKSNILIPHTKMHERSFVLIPLYELSKSWIHPQKKKNIKDLINSLDINDVAAIKLI